MSKGTGGQDGGMGADRVEPGGSQPTQPLSPEMPADLTDLEQLILWHVRAYPGLSVYAIARALRMGDPYGVGKDRVHRTLLGLQGRGLVHGRQGRNPENGRPMGVWDAADGV